MVISFVLKGILICLFLGLGIQKIVGHQVQVEIFRNLQLPQWFRSITGWVELLGAVLLVIGFWLAWVTVFAGVWLGVTMLGGFVSHLRVKDPIGKSVPAFVFFIISIALALLSYGEI